MLDVSHLSITGAAPPVPLSHASVVKYHRVSANATTKCRLLAPFAPTYVDVDLDQPSFLLVFVRALPVTVGEMMHLAAKAREKERRGLPINDWSMGQCIPVGTAIIHNVIWFSSSRCVWRTRFFQNFWIPVSRRLALESHSLPAHLKGAHACRVKEAAVEALTKNGIRPGPPPPRPASPTTTD